MTIQELTARIAEARAKGRLQDEAMYSEWRDKQQLAEDRVEHSRCEWDRLEA
jgi:transcription elongation GreA/GreB family factor